MYYEEKMIDGQLMCRHSPNGYWSPVSYIVLTRRLEDVTDAKNRLIKENNELRSKIKIFKRDDILDSVKERMDAEMCDLAEQYGLHHGDVAPMWQVQYDDIMMQVANLLGTWIEDNSEYTVEY